jgi:WD40 repeat protein/energy-coupling factor transporter ATP-binding protein EcfA2
VADDTYDVFVSYSRADGRHAAGIDSILRDKGLRPFFDRRNLDPGLPWLRALEKAIGSSKTAIVLIGPSGFGNTQQYERELAIIRQTGEPAFRVIPVILPETRSDLPFDFLRNLTWIDFSHVAKVSEAPDQLERLLQAVRGGLSADSEVSQAICPWRGLDAFREEDSAFFFGRGSPDDPKSAIGELVSKVREHSFVMVVGRSGSGKSSLVFAGLLPALRRERDQFWLILSLRPGTEPLQAIAEAFNPKPIDEGAVAYASRITEETEKLRRGGRDLLGTMAKQYLKNAEGKPDRLLLYIDQWEELYSQALSSSDKEKATSPVSDLSRFIDLLLTAARTSPVTIVGTVRADFYDLLIGHEGIRALLPTRQVLLARMSRSELENTMVGPASKVGLAFDPPTLVARILDEAGEDEGMLPLLQYALKESWALRKGNTITTDSYDRSGGVREAIRTTAERTFGDLSPADQQVARQLFLRLVTPGEGQEDTRARAAMPVDQAQRKIVNQFASQRTRLLVTGYDRAARPTVEVAHEALIRTWPRLRQWINSNREKLRSRAAILQAKADWEKSDRRGDMLLPAGLQLERARSLLADPGDITTDDINEFILLSSAREEAKRKEREDALERDKAQVAEIKAAQARTARLQQITRWAIAGAAAVALIAGGIVGWLQWDKAQQLARQEAALAESRQQLNEARANVSAGQASNAALKESLNRRQVDLDHAQANFLAELSAVKLSRSDSDSALRLAARGARIDLALPADKTRASPAAAALAAAASQANWRFVLGHDGAVLSAAYSPDGSRIVTAVTAEYGYVNTLRIWDAASAKEIAVLRHGGKVNSVAFSPDGSRIVTASGNTARIWDTASAKEIAVLRGHDYDLQSAAFSPDGSRIVTASWDKTARIWDAASAKEIAVLRGHDYAVNSAAFSPDGSRIVTASWDKTARIWDAATAKEIAILRGHDDRVWSAAFSPDGSRIVTASMDKTARIWDAATTKEIAVLRGYDNAVWSAAFSPDGSRIVTASLDKTARIWDAATAKEIAILRGHDGAVLSAAFSPDGSRIVTASGNTARIWDTASAKEIAVLRGHEDIVYSAAFSPDGSRIVTASGDKTARIWDTASGKQIAVLRHDNEVHSAAYSPAGSRIVTADNNARIWDVASAKEIAVLHGHSPAFSPDGSRIVTASGDKTARIWDVGSGKQIAVLRGHDDVVNSAAFSPNGLRIVTASDDKTARTSDCRGGTSMSDSPLGSGHEPPTAR